MTSRVRKFLSYYTPYKRLLIADLTCALLAAATVLALPLCARYITATILEQDAPNALTQIYLLGALMLGLILINTLCSSFVDYQGHMMGTLMERDMRAELFAHYQTLHFGFYDEQKTGQLMNRIINDTYNLGELYHHAPEDIVMTTLKFFGTFVILLTINVPLTLILFLFLPLMGAYAFYFNGKMNTAFRLSKDRIADVNAQVEDTLAGIRVVKSFTNERAEIAKFAYHNERFVASRRESYKSETYFYNGIVAFTQLFTVAVIVFGSTRIVGGQLDLADLVTYLLYVGILIEPIRTALNFLRLYQEGITGFDRFMDVLETPPAIQDAEDALELSQVRGNITFENVTFRYHDHQGDVLKNLSLHIKAGEFVALVGASGVGKTTLCALIPRFYEVTSGRILLDEHDLNRINLSSLRRHIGVVQQDIYLFAGTVAENIRYGRLDASDDDIITAAKKAHAHDFIMALPQGYDTDIGQRGIKLSGGQKQRLSIARAFLKDPAILIFDEATSNLDNESERAVQASLERLSQSRTTLVIAHRLSTIRGAQRIIVLDEHGVAEEGTHEALITKEGVYARLYEMQLRL